MQIIQNDSDNFYFRSRLSEFHQFSFRDILVARIRRKIAKRDVGVQYPICINMSRPIISDDDRPLLFLKRRFRRRAVFASATTIFAATPNKCEYNYANVMVIDGTRVSPSHLPGPSFLSLLRVDEPGSPLRYRVVAGRPYGSDALGAILSGTDPLPHDRHTQLDSPRWDDCGERGASFFLLPAIFRRRSTSDGNAPSRA